MKHLSLSTSIWLSLCISCAVLSYVWPSVWEYVRGWRSEESFRWSNIVSTRDLRYHKCWGSFECARLEVPMDWNNTGDRDTVSIAILRLPAKVPITDSRYGGPIILNPGGPGISGIRAGIMLAKAAQVLFDAAYAENNDYVSKSPNAKYYDILAFDPRGLNNTTPYWSCYQWAGPEISWALQGDDKVLGAPEADYLYMVARARAKGQGCTYSTLNPTGPKITAFMSTAMVARDIVEIAERHGEWRESRTKGRSDNGRLRWHKGEERINFWGMSYGTVLGSTLATMQPHRVNRFLLDAVNDADKYYLGQWRDNLVDADKAFQKLFKDCADAGPDICHLWAGSSGNSTEALLKSVLDSLQEQGPVPVPGDGTTGPQVITLSDVRTFLTASVMLPHKYWFFTASLLKPLLQRDGTLFASVKSQLRPFLQSRLKTPKASEIVDPHSPESHVYQWALDRPGVSVRCGDTRIRRDETEFYDYWQFLRNQSSWMADHWATLQSECIGWAAKPQWVFGDQHKISSNVTAGSMLFVGNSMDPVTPLASAMRMQQRFARSSLLTVDGAGHTSLSLANVCAGRAIRQFFQDETLVGGRTDCSMEHTISKGDLTAEAPLSLEDSVLKQALLDLQQGLG